MKRSAWSCVALMTRSMPLVIRKKVLGEVDSESLGDVAGDDAAEGCWDSNGA